MAKKTANKNKPHLKPGIPAKAVVPANASDRKWPWIGAILILTFISFYPALKCEFTNWDDNVYLNENPLIASLSSVNVKTIFSTERPVLLNYPPLTIL